MESSIFKPIAKDETKQLTARSWEDKSVFHVYVPKTIHKIYFLHSLKCTFLINIFCILAYTYHAKFLPMGSKIYKTDLVIVKGFNYFRYVPQNMDIFSHIFKMVTPRA